MFRESKYSNRGYIERFKRSDDMKYELLAEQNLALMLDFVDDENTKYTFV